MIVSFRENLLRLRTERNMTQEQLASLIGVSRQSVAKWESDRSYPEMDKLIKMTGIFGCTLDELVMGPSGHDACDDASAAAPVVGTSEAPSAEDASTNGTAGAAVAPCASPTTAVPATDVYGYDAHMRSFAKRIAWGVASIIIGVAGLLFAEAALTTMDYYESPLILAVLLVGIGVGLFLIIPAAIGHSSYMREHPVIRDFYTVEQKRAAGQKLALGIVVGIALIFFGVIISHPGSADGSALVYVIARVLSAKAAYHIASSVGAGMLLLCIAAAVWCFIYFGIMYSRVHVREYNHESLGELVEAYGEGKLAPEAMISQLSPEERQLLFDAEGIDGSDPDQVREFFGEKKRKGKLVSGVCAIIMIAATIIGLCLLFGIPTYSPSFWMAWVVGGLSCAIVSVVVNTFVK